MSGFSLGAAVFWYWSWTRALGGSIEIANDGIVQRSRGATMIFPRHDIVAIHLRRIRDTAAVRGLNGLLYRLLLVPMDPLTVEVELSRGLRKHWLASKFSTRGPGMPLFARRMLLRPKDPERFVRDATLLLGRETVHVDTGNVDADPVT